MQSDTFESLPEAQTLVSKAAAYTAMLRMLKYYFALGEQYGLGGMLGDLSPGVWADGTRGDPAAWSMWLKALEGMPLR